MPRIPGLKRFFRLADARGSFDAASVDDELRFHLDTRIDELVAAGTSPSEARRIAQAEFGDVNRYRADCLTIDSHHNNEVRVREFLASVWSDLCHGARALRAQPMFSLVAIATLALGIGATTSVFSTVSGVLLRPLPYANADRIVHIGERDVAKPGRGGTTSFENYDDWKRLAHGYVAMGLYNTFQSTLTGHGDPERVQIAGVTAELFDVFGVTPVLGRAIAPSDNLDGAAAVAVVSYDFWRTRLGADRSAVGQTILLNFSPAVVVGVLPPGFAAPGNLDRPIWVNFTDDGSDGRGGRSKNVYALLRPGVTLDEARAEMSQISARLAEQYPKDDTGSTAVVDPLADRVVGDVKRPLYLLFGASFFVLLIACANISNLLLVRGIARNRELAVRAALGAARGRIVRQLLTESALLAIVGSAIGVAIAAAATKYLVAMGPEVFQLRPPTLDIRVLIVAVALSVATTNLFGLLPALRSAPRDPQATLRASSGRVTGGQTARTRSALAIVQLSLAVVLLSVSLLVIKSFARVLRTDPGIRGDHLLTMPLTLPRARYDGSKSTIFYQQVEQRLAAMPDVRGVAFTSLIPFGSNFDRVLVSQFGGESERARSEALQGDRYVVTPSYFAATGVRLLRGRVFGAEDRHDAPVVCVVDSVFARRAFGSANAIGKQMKLPQRSEFATIVGIVTHVKTYGLDIESPGQIYLSNVQYPSRFMSVLVRTVGDPAAFVASVARVVHELDRDQPATESATMDYLMRNLLRARKFTLMLLGAFAAVALVLAVVGLYGVVAYGVSQRRREFGIRVALGARSGEIRRMVVLEGSRIAIAGAVIGTIGALAAGRLMSSLLFEVSSRDAVVLATVAIGMVCVAIVACLVPARRATRVDLADVLRGD